MVKSSSRLGRIGDLLHRELAKLISEQYSGSAYGMITVSGVTVSDDLSFARVYVTVLQDDKQQSSVDALNKAAVLFRTQMSKSLKLRVVPKFKFYYDESLLTGSRMDQLLKSVKDNNDNDNNDNEES